jgi:fructose-1,6-bisphosphatase/inositol monophosphatase family enzyme
MNPNIQNDQDYLAEKFRLLENHTVHASKIAILKIQSWKFALKTPEVGTRYQYAAEEMVRESLLCYIPNEHVLSEEGFYFAALEN